MCVCVWRNVNLQKYTPFLYIKESTSILSYSQAMPSRNGWDIYVNVSLPSDEISGEFGPILHNENNVFGLKFFHSFNTARKTDE